MTHDPSRPPPPSSAPASIWEQRPEWRRVSFGRNYTVSAAVAAGRILLTRSEGYGSTEDVPAYADFIRRVIGDGIGEDTPYVHVFDWSAFTGGSLAARERTIRLFSEQKRLKGVMMCHVSGILRMILPLTRRMYRFHFAIATAPDLMLGLRQAAGWISLDLPERLDLPEGFGPAASLPAETATAPTDRLPPDASADGIGCSMQRIGGYVSYGRLACSGPAGAVTEAAAVEVLSRCLAHRGSDEHVQAVIWDLGELEGRLSLWRHRRVIAALMRTPVPPAGRILVGGWRTRLAHAWVRRPAGRRGDTRLTASLAEAMDVSRERLLAVGIDGDSRVEDVQGDPAWTIGDSAYWASNEIIDGRIVHSVCHGNMRRHHVDPAFDIQRRLVARLKTAPGSYYLMADVSGVSGASPTARTDYVQKIRDLHRTHPMRMYVFYGASGFARAAIHLARQIVSFRVAVVKDKAAALGLIRADMATFAASSCVLPAAPEGTDPAVQAYVDDMLQYLGAVNWGPGDASPPEMDIAPGHPFKPVFEAVDLVRSDLEVLFEERKRAEETRQTLERRLAQSQKMEALGLLAGGVAHDLNNVLSGIVSYPDLLLMDMDGEHPMRRSVEVMRDAGQRASAIVQDLLTLARRGLSQVDVLNLNDVARRYLASPEHRSLCQAHPGVAVRADFDPALLNVNGAALQMEKTLMNLVLNAAESYADGSGEVVIRTLNRYVDRPFGTYDEVAEGDYAVLEVIDRGMGIAADELPRIFEPFYTKKVMGRSGTGLGMAVVWGTVQDHDGYIDIDSRMGHGTTITLYLPATRAALSQAAGDAESFGPRGRGERILVVDDVPEQREIATGILRRLGYDPLTADSGEDALSVIAHEAVDLVIMDMIMDPGMDGLDTCRRIWERLPDQKVIIVSGFADNARIAEARRLGALAFVKKPYGVKTIGEAVAGALAGDPE